MNDYNEHNNPGYEKRDISIGKVLGWGIGTTLLIIIFIVFLNEYFMYVKEDVINEQVLQQESISLKELRSHEDSLLTSYGWSDTTKTTYRIPIDQAMQLVADSVAKTK